MEGPLLKFPPLAASCWAGVVAFCVAAGCWAGVVAFCVAAGLRMAVTCIALKLTFIFTSHLSNLQMLPISVCLLANRSLARLPSTTLNCIKTIIWVLMLLTKTIRNNHTLYTRSERRLARKTAIKNPEIREISGVAGKSCLSVAVKEKLISVSELLDRLVISYGWKSLSVKKFVMGLLRQK